MHNITTPNKKGLREFGLTMGGIIGILFGLLLPWIFERSYPVWPWILGAVLVVWGLLWPKTLGPVYKVWMRVGLLLGWVSTRIILGIIFYLLITPIGVLARLFGYNPMASGFLENASTYRKQSKIRSAKHLEKPF